MLYEMYIVVFHIKSYPLIWNVSRRGDYRTHMLQLITPSFLSPLLCDSAYPWQIGFQDGATPSAEGVLELHDHILFYLIVITVLVFWMLGVTMVTFNSSKVGIVHKYSNHGTLIELIWTITPAFVLIAIAFPSFKLLYLLDEVISPSMTIKVAGHQW